MTEQNRNSFKILSILSLLALASCAAESDNATSQSQYQAEVIRTEYGVAHITADSYGGLGYGEAYAAAEDHVCNMALALAQSRGESALALGMGATSANAARDIVVKALNIPNRASTALAQQNPDIREWLQGYAAGYNDFLAANSGGVRSKVRFTASTITLRGSAMASRKSPAFRLMVRGSPDSRCKPRTSMDC